MVQALKSVSNPTPALESAPEAFEKVEIPGSLGKATSEESRSSRAFEVSGKSTALRSPGNVPAALESVIGTDERQRIVDTELYPWRMISALRIRGAEGTSTLIGTGWFVGPKTLLTAGHCVHHQRFLNGWANTIEVSPGRNGDETPYGTVTANRFSSLSRWVSDADPDYDIGCIHLDEPLGNQTGWFATESWEADALEGTMLNIAGYPADRGNGREMYFHANRVTGVTDRRVFYDIDTFGGQSGAPVWIYRTADTPRVGVAIHAYGTGGTPSGLGFRSNSAPRLIPSVMATIQNWITADGGLPS